jgi:hypothetical protein
MAVPIVLFCVGFLALIVLNCLLCGGVAKLCTSRKADDQHNLTCCEYCISLTFTIFFIICFLSAHVLYIGYTDVADGLEVMRSSNLEISEGYYDMNVDAASLHTHTDLLIPMCEDYGCLEEAEKLEEGVVYMMEDLRDIPDDVEDINIAIDDAEKVINLLTFAMYCALVATLATYVITQFCCKAQPIGAICCGNIAFVLIAFIGILWMLITSITADFCYENPTVNTLDALSASKDQMYLIWYSSCYSGENPVFSYVNVTTAANEAIIAYIGSNSSTQANNIRQQTTYITSGIEKFIYSTHQSCSPVQSAWLLMVNEGVCDHFYHGVRIIWICEVTACISLFFLMITGAIIGMGARYNEASVVPVSRGAWGGSKKRRDKKYEAGSSAMDDLEFEDEEEGDCLGDGRGPPAVAMQMLGEDHSAKKEREEDRRMSLDFEY